MEKECLECSKDISNRHSSTKYCTSRCSSISKRKRNIKKYPNIINMRSYINKNRKNIVKKMGQECYFCGNNKLSILEIHHINYDNNELNNLLLLCKKCHTKLHKIINISEIK